MLCENIWGNLKDIDTTGKKNKITDKILRSNKNTFLDT